MIFWLRMIVGDEELISLAVRIAFTLLLALAMLISTSSWAIGVMGQPGGMYWLAAQSPKGRALVPVSVGVPPSAPGVPAPPPPVATPGPVLPAGAWVDGAPYNQYDPRSYRSSAVYATWHPAACSAAALAWLLRAYGHPVGALDDSIALLGPNISSAVGLMDHRGGALAAVLAHQGLNGWNVHLSSTAELQAALARGPLAMDGQRWFGVGHWFVAVSSDANGVHVRESSGHDVRYLTWAQLYGPVGWSGWAVGVGAGSPSNQARLDGAPIL